MFRTNDESRGSFDFDLSQRSLPHDSPGTNKSFISTSSSTAGIALQSTASSSKAVLAALRALQDKIRRLESEKAQALDDAAQLRTQLKSLEIENDHTRERDALHSQKLLQDARMAYEKVLSEKTDMENRLRTLDKQLEKVTSDLNSAVNENKDLEVSKRSGSEKLQQLENQILEMELKLQESMQKEQELSSAMVWETRRHEEEIHSLKSRVESLTSEASVSSLRRVERESKLVELDHLIGQLLSVNETLVNQLSQRGLTPAVAGRGAESRAKVSGAKKKRSLSAPRPTSVPEVTAPQSSVRIARDRKTVIRAPAPGAAGVGGLHEMHEMYVSLAKQITGKDSSSGHLQPQGAGVKKKRITSMKQRALKGKSQQQHNHPSLADDQSFSSSAFETLSRKSYGSSVPPSAASASELQGVIQSLEEEFEVLNRQYQQLLQPKKLGTAGSAYGPEDRSRELVSVIQRLHKKGEQLRALKSSPQKGTA